MVAVRFECVTKTFSRHSGHVLLRQRLANWIHRRHRERFEALTNVSFALGQGECLGIVGHNGAGKSTLLNLITGLCCPSSGVIAVEGKVAALLEMGSGFHPDLTGAENLRLKAAMLGLGRKQVKELFSGIVRFSGLEEFIDEPLRTYSSGMMARLAFAVAINVEPDILIIDEVLGVGDLLFFEKCVHRIEEFRGAGKTIIFVSHSLPMVSSLCDRVIWLDRGRIVMDGPAATIIEAYSAKASGEPVPTAGSAR